MMPMQSGCKLSMHARIDNAGLCSGSSRLGKNEFAVAYKIAVELSTMFVIVLRLIRGQVELLKPCRW